MPQITKPESANSWYDREILGALLTPSWLSGLLAILGSLAIVAGTIIALHFPGSSLQQLIESRHHQAPASISDSYQTVDTGLSANTFISNLPLFVFWGCVGLIVYSFVINIYNAFYQAAHLKEELEYVHADRRAVVRTAELRLALRLVVLLIWIVFLRVSVKYILTYVVAVMQFVNAAPSALDAIVYTLLAFVVMAVTLHINTVLLRLMALRPRLFGGVVILRHPSA